jgi:hypothetical protein
VSTALEIAATLRIALDKSGASVVHLPLLRSLQKCLS